VDEETREKFSRAIGLYNGREFLASQELFEEVHGAADEAERPLVRGLLMLACSMHLHFRRGGGRGVTKLLRQCLFALEEFRPRRLGVEVDELCGAVEAYLGELDTRRKPGAGVFDRWLAPRIRFAPRG